MRGSRSKWLRKKKPIQDTYDKVVLLIAKIIFYPCWILEIYFTYAVTDTEKVMMRFCNHGDFMNKVPKDFSDNIVLLLGTSKSEDLYKNPFRFIKGNIKFLEL